MAKRKHDKLDDGSSGRNPSIKSLKTSARASPNGMSSRPLTVQIITGSYERALHGITATISSEYLEPSHIARTESTEPVLFADSFLFNAHASAVRCLAISPSSENASSTSQKVILATGGTDERINLYHLSNSAPQPGTVPSEPVLASTAVAEDHRNRQLGALLHHSASITTLQFPTRSKLLSAAADNTIAFTRTRDWTLLSTIKVPVPKPAGRPSGDTAGPGEVPTGINDFAIHPSLKLMVSVGKGERCMRLWNLVTGKKAGVLNFEKDILRSVGESKWGSGEARKVEWDPEGEEFVVGFERGAVVFGMVSTLKSPLKSFIDFTDLEKDSKPKASIIPSPSTKIHQIRYLPRLHGSNAQEIPHSVLAISTENGRIVFYSSSSGVKLPADEPKNSQPNMKIPNLSSATFLGQLGGDAAGITSRIKDFTILTLSTTPSILLFVTANSDGAIRLWTVDIQELQHSALESTTEIGKAAPEPPQEVHSGSNGVNSTVTNGKPERDTLRQVGRLCGLYETGNRITCMTAFLMQNGILSPEAETVRMEEVEEEIEEERNGVQRETRIAENLSTSTGI